LDDLRQLLKAESQLILLTATLPPSMKKELFDRLNIEPSSVAVFRGSTRRTNISYRVQQALPGDE